MTTDTPSGAIPLVVLATQMPDRNGIPITDADLRTAGAVAVNYCVRADVAGATEQVIHDLVDPSLEPGRRVRPAQYAAELARFVRHPVGAAVVSRTGKGRAYLVGRVTSPYTFAPGRFSEHPHVRQVDWVGVLARGTVLGGNTRACVRPVSAPEALAAIAFLLPAPERL